MQIGYLSSLPAHWLACLRNPQAIGSIAPSSEQLARAMLAALLADFCDDLIELGGGTGAVTRVLLDAVGNSHLLVVERDLELLSGLRRRWPALRLLHANVASLDALLARQMHRYAAIVSGLPMLNMRPQIRHNIVKTCFNVMPATGGPSI